MVVVFNHPLSQEVEWDHGHVIASPQQVDLDEVDFLREKLFLLLDVGRPAGSERFVGRAEDFDRRDEPFAVAVTRVDV